MYIGRRKHSVATLEDVHQTGGAKRMVTLRRAVTAASESYVEIQAGTTILTCGPLDGKMLESAMRSAAGHLWRLADCKDCDVDTRIREIFSNISRG